MRLLRLLRRSRSEDEETVRVADVNTFRTSIVAGGARRFRLSRKLKPGVERGLEDADSADRRRSRRREEGWERRRGMREEERQFDTDRPRVCCSLVPMASLLPRHKPKSTDSVQNTSLASRIMIRTWKSWDWIYYTTCNLDTLQQKYSQDNPSTQARI